MTEEKWNSIKSQIKDKFEVLEDFQEDIELLSTKQTNLEAHKDVLVFIGPVGKMMLEYIVRPVVLDKKEHYSSRMGTSSQTEYIYSNDEFTRRVEAFKDKDGNWEKIDQSFFN